MNELMQFYYDSCRRKGMSHKNARFVMTLIMTRQYNTTRGKVRKAFDAYLPPLGAGPLL